MNPVAAIARSGMNAAELSLRTAANNVANAMTPGFERQRVVARDGAGGGVRAEVQAETRSATETETEREGTRAEAAEGQPSPSQEPTGVQPEDVVAQLQARNAFLANLQVFRRADEAQRRLIDDRA